MIWMGLKTVIWQSWAESEFAMSADNGVYILKTTCDGGFEYRVAHSFASDAQILDEPGILCTQYLVETFGESEVFHDYQEAFKKASEVHDGYGYTEYGICEVEPPLCLPFSVYQKAYEDLGRDLRWSYCRSCQNWHMHSLLTRYCKDCGLGY